MMVDNPQPIVSSGMMVSTGLLMMNSMLYDPLPDDHREEDSDSQTEEVTWKKTKRGR
jgi:hypothetical protein